MSRYLRWLGMRFFLLVSLRQAEPSSVVALEPLSRSSWRVSPERWFWGGVTVFFGLLVVGGALVLVGGALGGRQLAWARALMAWFEKMG